MGESKMPAKIWITMEDHPASWAGSFRRWHASDLDHGDEYPTYTRADLVEPLVEALEHCQSALAMMIAPDAIKTTSVLHAFAQATEAECKARTALSRYRAAVENKS